MRKRGKVFTITSLLEMVLSAFLSLFLMYAFYMMALLALFQHGAWLWGIGAEALLIAYLIYKRIEGTFDD